MEDVHVGIDAVYLAPSEGVEEGGLADTVAANQTVLAAHCKLQRRIAQQLTTSNDDREGFDVDVGHLGELLVAVPACRRWRRLFGLLPLLHELGLPLPFPLQRLLLLHRLVDVLARVEVDRPLLETEIRVLITTFFVPKHTAQDNGRLELARTATTHGSTSPVWCWCVGGAAVVLSVSGCSVTVDGHRAAPAARGGRIWLGRQLLVQSLAQR
mmetsp:Transcript_40080/g.100296  ORF Transcript_40080/g.100296 Transcript_40080/m.100296 type:complete len:212 (+) Transcript_40080:1562-2197(+)